MKLFKYLSSYFLLITIIYVSQCSAVDPKPPAPPTNPINVGTVPVYFCSFDYEEGTIEWHQTFQDRITTVITPNLDSLNYTFHLGLEDFDNNTSASWILHGKTHTVWSSECGIHTAGISSRDLPVIYYNNDKKVDYQCNEHIAEKHTRYMVLIKENDVKVIDNTNTLGKADDGSIIACFYFKKIDKDMKVVREVVNKHKLVYKEREDPTTTTTAKPVTKPPAVPKIVPTTPSPSPTPTTAATRPPTTAFTKSVTIQTTTSATEFSDIAKFGNIIEPGNIQEARDLPVIYYHNDKKVDYQCNENIAEKHTRYMVLIKENDMKVINSSNNLGKADDGSIIACFYIKKIDKDTKVVRELVNKHKLVYKEREDPTTTSTTTAKPVTKPPAEVPTIASTTPPPPAPTTAATRPPTTAFTKSTTIQTTTSPTKLSNITKPGNITKPDNITKPRNITVSTNGQEGNKRTIIGYTVGVLMLILVITIAAVAGYEIFQRYKKTGEIGVRYHHEKSVTDGKLIDHGEENNLSLDIESASALLSKETN